MIELVLISRIGVMIMQRRDLSCKPER